ncbi:hypothetical protein BDV96DRAFT_294208 [Lophiotrema nucula]|uniref:Uncharacterized protein n=1 Tax=Lophiotrema nucula TaxID=690887 RepID=A0A6A5YKH3_9PLEO|nr:hypothetical protein BDV96DRAFT_294208 [Lophiotrema nucula]
MHLSTTSILTYLTALLTLTLGAGSALIAEHDGALVLATSVLPIIATTEQDVATALFCTGPNFSGDCHHCALGVHDCGTFLPNFPVVGSFRPDVGFACTLYGYVSSDAMDMERLVVVRRGEVRC